MNKNRYILVRALQFLWGIIPSILSIFLPRNSRLVIFNAQFNNNFEHNSKALFLHMLNEEPNLVLKFVVNDDEKRRSLIDLYGPHFITNYRFFDLFMILRSPFWVCSSLETPIGGVFLNFRRVVCHLGHGSPIKSIGLGEKYLNVFKSIYYRLIRTNFTYFMSSSPMFDFAWKECLGISEGKVVRCPQARCDQVFSADKRLASKLLRNDTNNILYAPTWRPFSETKLFPFSDFDLSQLDTLLEKNNSIIYLRLHPNFESDVEKALLLCDRVRLLTKDDVEDVNVILGEFDLVITDYSSIYIDFLLTQKPLIFIPYDFSEYNKHVGFSIDYYKYTPGPKPSSFIEFSNEMSKLLTDREYFLNHRIDCNSRLNAFTKDHSKTAMEKIMSLK